MTSLAASAAPSGANGEIPRAIRSALRNSTTSNAPRSSRGAAVDFPAPFGPPSTTTTGASGCDSWGGCGRARLAIRPAPGREGLPFEPRFLEQVALFERIVRVAGNDAAPE